MKGRAKLGNCGYAFKHSKKMHLQWKTLGKNTGKILRFELNNYWVENVYIVTEFWIDLYVVLDDRVVLLLICYVTEEKLLVFLQEVFLYSLKTLVVVS